MTSLDQALEGEAYTGYTYAYPHKTAYSHIDPPIPLQCLWEGENRQALFLYFHIPFCEMRCGFCNLFTITQPQAGLQAAYLQTIQRQAESVRRAIAPASFARLAIGGGTPTYLSVEALGALFDIAEQTLGVDLAHTPISVETSPGTAEFEKLRLLRQRGVDRISIGIQSFVEAEVKAVGRAQKRDTVEGALERIRQAGFPTLNIDLIYGLPGQTLASWLGTLQNALRFAPQELYLYPLYVRPLTGMDRTVKTWQDRRLALYRAGRDWLQAAGYEQVSMRMFRASHAPRQDGPLYCCQEDGMVGLGCGARSYTRACHYSNEYAVSRPEIRAILEAYTASPARAFEFASHGYLLDEEDEQRRYVIKTLFRVAGLDLESFRQRFGASALESLPELNQLLEQGLATQAQGHLRLNQAGLERSDALGPWLYSARVRQRMQDHELR